MIYEKDEDELELLKVKKDHLRLTALVQELQEQERELVNKNLALLKEICDSLECKGKEFDCQPSFECKRIQEKLKEYEDET